MPTKIPIRVIIAMAARLKRICWIRSWERYSLCCAIVLKMSVSKVIMPVCMGFA
jgi:hypothetical protein